MSVVIFSLLGCFNSHNGTNSTAKGSITIAVAWPNKAGQKTIPDGTASIGVVVLKGNENINPEIYLNSGTTSTTIADVPCGSVTVQAKAYSQANGQGDVLAYGETTITVLADQTNNASINLEPFDPILNSIYTVGCVHDSWGTELPCYWKGQTRTIIDNNSGPSCFARHIFVSGGVVYTAGWHATGTNVRIPCYWVGTSRVDLPGNGEVCSIYVSNGIVYTAGYNQTGPNESHPCYWSGTNRIDLSGRNGLALSIFVYNGTVYTTGSVQEDGGSNVACYWTGTTRTVLATNNGGVSSIYVSDGIPYIAGYYYNLNESRATPCYWAGTTRIDLDLPGVAYGAVPISIYVSGGTVYTAGQFETDSSDSACYWIGTTFTNIPTIGTEANCIFVSGGRVLIHGTDGIWIGDRKFISPGDADYTTAIFVE